MTGLRLGAALLIWPSLAAARPSPPARDPGGVLELASCSRQAGEYRATLEDTIVLDRAFLDPARPDEPQLREAIGHQLKYLWGHYRNQPALHARTQVVLSAEAPVVELRKVTPRPYGRELALAWTQTPPHLVVDQPYQLRAVERGFSRADDPGLAVDYRVTFKVALCGEPRPAATTLPTMLPRDPWLMHWHVPRAAHRRLCYHGDCVVTSPCNDDDYADLPHPFYHWYDWYPDRAGPDADGRGFDCRALLHEGQDYFARTARLTRLSASGGGAGDLSRLRAALAGKRGPLRATVLIGVLDHAWPKDQLGYPELAAALGGGAALPGRAEALLAEPGARERGTLRLLRLMAALPGLMDVDGGDVVVEGEYLRVSLSGTLRRSRRALELALHVGLTDLFGPTPPAHWRILREALGRDDVIVYAGHSGIGENFRLARIQKEVGEPAASLREAFARAPYQLIAFLSCYSYMYFGQDLVEAAGESASGRELVYTGTDFTAGDRGALSVLDLVDQVAAGAARPALHHLAPEDFLLVKRADPR